MLVVFLNLCAIHQIVTQYISLALFPIANGGIYSLLNSFEIRVLSLYW
jgi:hypothetical protein